MEAPKDSLRFHEKDLEYKALELDDRESGVVARERDYNKLVDDVQSEAFKLCQDYRCLHKVMLLLVF